MKVPIKKRYAKYFLLLAQNTRATTMSKDFTEIDTDTPKGRLLAFCRMYGLSSNREIEKLLDLGNGYFRTPDKGMNTGTLCKIAKRYPTLNLNWLICGCGHIYSQDNTLSEGEKISTIAESHTSYNPSASAFPSTSVAVRIFESLEAFCHPERESLPPHWLMIEKNLLHDRADALVKITDESLSPEYSPGEYLLVGPASGSLAQFIGPRDKRLLLILPSEGNPLVRIAQRYPGQSEMFLFTALHPDKRLFPDLICTLGQIVAFWEVKGVFHL